MLEFTLLQCFKVQKATTNIKHCEVRFKMHSTEEYNISKIMYCHLIRPKIQLLNLAGHSISSIGMNFTPFIEGGLSLSKNDFENQTEEITAADDFKQLFDGPWQQLLHLVWCITLLVVNTTYNYLLIKYEKFGGDPMKRSLRNQLIGQIGYVQLLGPAPPMLVWIFRVNITGPINQAAAALVVAHSVCHAR